MGSFPSREKPKINEEAVDNFRQIFGSQSRFHCTLDENRLLDKILDLDQLTLNLVEAKHPELSEIRICLFQQPEPDLFQIQGYFTQSKYLVNLKIHQHSFHPFRNRQGWWVVTGEEIWARNCCELTGLCCLMYIRPFCKKIQYQEELKYYLPTQEAKIVLSYLKMV